MMQDLKARALIEAARAFARQVTAGAPAAAQAGNTPPGNGVEAARAFVHRLAQDVLVARQMNDLPALIPSHRPALLFQPAFFDPCGNDMLSGGAERYMLDLADLLRGMGFTPLLFQMASEFWVRPYRHLQVVGLPVGQDHEAFRALSGELAKRAELSVFSPFTYAPEKAPERSIGISHGIYWDHPWAQAEGYPQQALARAPLCRRLVSVDTNTINWFRATSAELASRFEYVPNYVDTRHFTPSAAGHLRDDGPVVVLFPRRLCAERGFDLLMDAAPTLLRRNPRLVLHVVGKGDAERVRRLEEMKVLFGDRLLHWSLPPDRMLEAYAGAHIVLIPTLASEGTSLSCLEAMACGKAVIATNVGGLPDLVLDRFNGLLIEPRADRLVAAVEELVGDAALRRRLGQCAREVAECFGIERWRASWCRIVEEVVPERSVPPLPLVEETSRGWAILHPASPCIEYGHMRQRPQHLMRAFAQAGVLSLFQNSTHPPSAAEEPLLQVMGPEAMLHPEGQVVYIYNPELAGDLDRYAESFLIYDMLDDLSLHSWEEVHSQHRKLLERADVVLTTSWQLRDRLREIRPDVILVPNGVWPEDFASARAMVRPAGRPPVVGYAGAIAHWFDFALMDAVAAALPDWEFRLVGWVSEPEQMASLAAKRPNIRHEGVLTYAQLPEFYGSVDIGIIPFVLNDITHPVSPVKLFEYFAAGRPVVATPMREIAKDELVLLADGPGRFVAQLRKALTLRDDPAFRERSLAAAMAASWGGRARAVLDALGRRLREASGRPRPLAEPEAVEPDSRAPAAAA